MYFPCGVRYMAAHKNFAGSILRCHYNLGPLGLWDPKVENEARFRVWNWTHVGHMRCCLQKLNKGVTNKRLSPGRTLRRKANVKPCPTWRGVWQHDASPGSGVGKWGSFWQRKSHLVFQPLLFSEYECVSVQGCRRLFPGVEDDFLFGLVPFQVRATSFFLGGYFNSTAAASGIIERSMKHLWQSFCIGGDIAQLYRGFFEEV